MSDKRIKNFIKKNKKNSGFTLTELLAGLFMSIFVSGALGFGLMQIMQATAREQAKSTARNEASRAVEFISDELRRAQSIEVDTSIASLNTADNPATPDDESVAPTYSLPAGGTARLALRLPGVSERIIYSVAPPPANSPWKGPLVLYRWGPDLNANGAYTNAANPGAWDNDALIDEIDNTNQSTNCGVDASSNPVSVSYQGFFACVVDDDGDGVTEDGATDTNGDGVVDANDSNDDVDGVSNIAQIFLTGGIDTDNIAGNDSNYTAQTRTVARAKEVSVSSAQAAAVSPATFRSLEADYTCNSTIDENGNPIDSQGYPIDSSGNRISGQNPRKPKTWKMRIDFDNSDYDTSGDRPDRDNAVPWIHEQGRQAQPITINASKDLIIHSIPYGQADCFNADKGNPSASATDPLSNFVADNGVDNFNEDNGDDKNTHTVSYKIQFQATVDNRADNLDYWKTFNGNTTGDPNDADYYNNPNVDSSGKIIVLKNGSTLVAGASIDTVQDVAAAPLYPGIDYNKDGSPDRPSLGRFLYEKGYAEAKESSESETLKNKADKNSSDYDPNYDPLGGYKIKGLDKTDRIIAIEIAKEDNGDTVDGIDGPDDSEAHPGFDLQDSVFIMTHKSFGEPHGDNANNTGEASNESGNEANNYGNEVNNYNNYNSD